MISCGLEECIAVLEGASAPPQNLRDRDVIEVSCGFAAGLNHNWEAPQWFLLCAKLRETSMTSRALRFVRCPMARCKTSMHTGDMRFPTVQLRFPTVQLRLPTVLLRSPTVQLRFPTAGLRFLTAGTPNVFLSSMFFVFQRLRKHSELEISEFGKRNFKHTNFFKAIFRD